MLYKNPRGISCARCHGIHAKGKTLVIYKYKKRIIKIKTPDIRNVPFDKLKTILLHSKKASVMPKYTYLTNSEIEALYLYIHSQIPPAKIAKNKKDEHDISKHAKPTKNNSKR